MKRYLAILLAAAALVAGCSSGGAPRAAAPETTFDFGEVPTSEKDARTKEFTIQNDGAGDLKISDVQVKVLQGC
jgi:ABC-type uncharacterized transport system auxiliary subunit